ncbi:hypothetical protein QQ045_007639 [Rhodiola kirilowii]
MVDSMSTRFEGDRPRFGDRDGYRGGRGAGGDFGGQGYVVLQLTTSLPSGVLEVVLVLAEEVVASGLDQQARICLERKSNPEKSLSCFCVYLNYVPSLYKLETHAEF